MNFNIRHVYAYLKAYLPIEKKTKMKKLDENVFGNLRTELN